MNIKSAIKAILPYSVVINMNNKRALNSIQDYYSTNLVPFTEVDSNYRYIVSCQGFGYSGSGVISDLLREYEKVDVQGFIDTEGSLGQACATDEEIDFIRYTGGILDFERYVNSKNIFHNDAALHLLISNFAQSSLCQKLPECRILAKQFVSNLISGICECENQSAYNTILQSEENRYSSIFYMRNMSVQEYRQLSKRFLIHFFNALHHHDSQVLVLDQLFTDFEFDNSRNLEYIPNLKTIVVYRDPRDVFAFANKEKVSWLPYKDVDTFITMYKNCLSKLDFDSSDYLVIRFEEIVTNKYDYWVRQVENYLGLDSSNHIRPKSFFDPQSSCKSIGRWKNFPELNGSFAKIRMALPMLCYNN